MSSKLISLALVLFISCANIVFADQTVDEGDKAQTEDAEMSQSPSQHQFIFEFTPEQKEDLSESTMRTGAYLIEFEDFPPEGLEQISRVLDGLAGNLKAVLPEEIPGKTFLIGLSASTYPGFEMIFDKAKNEVHLNFSLKLLKHVRSHQELQFVMAFFVAELRSCIESTATGCSIGFPGREENNIAAVDLLLEQKLTPHSATELFNNLSSIRGWKIGNQRFSDIMAEKRDLIGIHITSQSRVAGVETEFRLDQQERNHSFGESVDVLIGSESFQAHLANEVNTAIEMARKAEGVFRGLEDILERIQKYDGQDEDYRIARSIHQLVEDYFENFLKSVMATFEVPIGQYLDIKQRAKWRMQIHQILHQKLVQEVQAYFGETIDFGEDKDLRSSKERFLRFLTEFSFVLPDLNPGYAFKELLEKERWLEEARKKKEKASDIARREENVAEARAAFERSISYFENSENLEAWFRERYTKPRARDKGRKLSDYDIENRLQSDWYLNLREGQWGNPRGELFRFIGKRVFIDEGFRLEEFDVAEMSRLQFKEYKEAVKEVTKTPLELAFESVLEIRKDLKRARDYDFYSKKSAEELAEIEEDYGDEFEEEIQYLLENPPELSEGEITSKYYKAVFEVYDRLAGEYSTQSESQEKMNELNRHVVGLLVGKYTSDFKRASERYLKSQGNAAKANLKRIVDLHWQVRLQDEGAQRGSDRLPETLMTYYDIDTSLVTSDMVQSAESQLNKEALATFDGVESPYQVIASLRNLRLDLIAPSYSSDKKKYRGPQIQYDKEAFVKIAVEKIKRLDPEISDSDARTLVYFIRSDLSPSNIRYSRVLGALKRLSQRENSPLYPAFLNVQLLVGFYKPRDSKVEDRSDNLILSMLAKGRSLINELLPSSAKKLAKALYELRNHLHIRQARTEKSFRYNEFEPNPEDKDRPTLINRHDYSIDHNFKGHYGILRNWAKLYPGDWVIPSLFYGRDRYISIKRDAGLNWVSDQFKVYVREYSNGDSEIESFANATFRFWRDFDGAYLGLAKNGFDELRYDIESLIYGSHYDKYRKRSVAVNPRLLARYIGYHRGIERFLDYIEEQGRKAPYRMERGRRGGSETEVSREELFDMFLDSVDLLGNLLGPENKDNLKVYDPVQLAQGLEIFLTHKSGGRSARVDTAFEYLFELKEQNPKVAEILRNPKLVKGLAITANKWKLAQWQLAQNELFVSASEVRRKGQQIIWDEEGIRPELVDVLFNLETYFSFNDPAINQILSWIEDTLQTNPSESKLVESYRVDIDSWRENRDREYGITPYTVNRYLGSPENNYVVLKVLLGVDDEDTRRFNEENLEREYIKSEMDGVIRSYQINGDNYRTMVNTLLLDEKDGIFSGLEYQEKTIDLILGAKSDDPVLRLVLQTYVDVLPTSEAKLVLAKILSSMSTDYSNEGSKVSLRLILESAGPLGAKVAQFLVTSHLVDESTREDLRHFFNKVDRPARFNAINQVKQAFGDSASEIVHFGDIKGSGSINYAMEVFIKDPEDSSRLKPLIVRLQKDHIVGQIANENTIWEQIEQNFSSDSDPSVRRFARMIGEIRNYAMATLNKDGSEVNHQHERDLYPIARQSYEDLNANPETGYRVEVAKHNDYGQSLIDENYQNRTTVYDSLNMMSLDEVSDRNLKAELARQIAWTELRALFAYGVYDPDGHVGNWVVDTEKKRLLRIDYALLTESLPADHVQTFKGLLIKIIKGDLSSIKEFIVSNFKQIFNVSENPDGLKEALSEVLGRREFAQFTNPVDRILYLQGELEELFLAQGHVVALPFKESVRIPLASLAKINLYRDYMPTMDFANLVAAALEIPRRDLLLSGTRTRLSQMTQYLRRGWKKSPALTGTSTDQRTDQSVDQPAGRATVGGLGQGLRCEAYFKFN